MQDELGMRRARELGLGARRTAPRNPWVGCVIVRDGVIVGEGATCAPGGPHAEVVALRAAGEHAVGATAYVTLEPCSHHGSTPPCTDALIDAGITRVVVALADPDPLVNGSGLALLRDAGIEVALGSEAGGVALDLAPYLHHRSTGRAWCLVKTAMSFDARSAARDGSSQWITDAPARADAHELRADSQAVVVGAGTALRDRPRLTVRNCEHANGALPASAAPLRVLLDARGRVPATGPLFDMTLAPTLVITTEHCAPSAAEAWRATGAVVEVVSPSSTGTGVELTEMLACLGTRSVLQAMVEGGPSLHGALFDAGLVDRVVAYVAPTVLGRHGMPAFGVEGPTSLADASRFAFADVRQVGSDLRVEFSPCERVETERVESARVAGAAGR